ncbi:hypothetical protein B0H13DRAFT_2354190 [Mycena leptocephala]|nr:hypothetical protein B0H13DRAFT_2354190 [Mycena leptocephala]
MVSYRKVFGRRLARDLKEGRRHREAFEAFTELLEAEKPELVATWGGWVREWESEQHTDGAGSPFEMTNPVHTMKDIRLRLGKEELTKTGDGATIERQHTPSTFISMGLEIEQTQRILTIDIKALANPTALQELDFVKRRTALLKRVNRFRKLQRTYMPHLVRNLSAAQREIWDDKARGAEALKLFMPSELGENSRARTCEEGLDKIEEELRVGELQESLEELRQGLRTRTMANRVLRQITVRVHKAKLRYRYARNALLRLRGHGGWERKYRVLEEGDVRGINERAVGEEEEAERERLRQMGEIEEGGIAAAGVVAAGEGTHTMSWIWYETKIDGSEEDLVEALRVEWCKAYARLRRWNEDVVIVDEEMKRTIEFGEWMALEWEQRATARTANMTPVLAEGLPQWAGLREKARVYLAGITPDARDGARGDGVRDGAQDARDVVVDVEAEEFDPEDDEGDVEGDEPVEDEGTDDEDSDDI